MPHHDPIARRVTARLAVTAVALALALTACAEDRSELDASLAAGRAAFEAQDFSEMTRIARELVAAHPDDVEVRQLAATAAWGRGDLDDAIEHAEAGLLGETDDVDLRASLHLIVGSAAAQRYGELRDPRDWGRANSHLEEATAAGRHVVDAAHRLARMHASSDSRADRGRFTRFARLVVTSEPDGEAADDVRRLAEALGLSL